MFLRKRKFWQWFGVVLVLSAVALFVIAKIVLSHADPILKGRVVETLSTRFQSRVELDSLHVTIAHGLGVTGGGLRIYPPDDVIAAGAKDPLIAIQNFDFRADVMGLFLKPMHVSSVHVSGLIIHIPPKEYRQQAPPRTKRHHGKIKIIVGQILCDNSSLIIGTAKPGKDPKQFDLEHIVLHDLGGDKAWPYDANLTNAVPRGNIHAVGTFGPWNLESPGDSTVTGDYTFDHADLNTITGIGGILSSVGKFTGQLDRIIVDGVANVPGFQLDTAHHPVPLHTQFHAIVDGTSGDTYLQPVDATLGSSRFSCSGAIINIKGKGHQIDLDVDIPSGQVRDFLDLAVKTRPPIMTGTLQMKAKLNIPPGKQSVTRKIGIHGQFVLTRIHFSNPQIEDKVDMLSLRAQGKPHEAHSGAPDVHSQMRSTFMLRSGQLTLPDLSYMLPGATVNLGGQYTLDGKKFDFAGNVRTNAKLSNMVSTWWKSILLKPVDPFFEKHGAGAEIPVKITGTESAPKFGVDIGRK